MIAYLPSLLFSIRNIPIERSAVHPSPVVAPQQLTAPVDLQQQQPVLPEPAVVTSSEAGHASKEKDSWKETSSSESEAVRAAEVHEEAEGTEGGETPSAGSSEVGLYIS